MEDAEILDAPQPDQPIAVVQPALEVVVTDQQHTMTFNVGKWKFQFQIQIQFKIVTTCINLKLCLYL